MLFVSFLGFIILNFICFVQRDIKSFLAYSSIVHINFLIFNLFVLYKITKFSSFLLIISHGFSSSFIFFLVGEIYKFNGSRIFYYFKSFFFKNFIVIIFIFILFFININVPFTLGFLRELKSFLRIFCYKKFFLFVLFIYFMYSFFYSLIILFILYLGKNDNKIQIYGFFSSFILIFYRVNFFIILLV